MREFAALSQDLGRWRPDSTRRLDRREARECVREAQVEELEWGKGEKESREQHAHEGRVNSCFLVFQKNKRYNSRIWAWTDRVHRHRGRLVGCGRRSCSCGAESAGVGNGDLEQIDGDGGQPDITYTLALALLAHTYA
jgi:hypothetical protein